MATTYLTLNDLERPKARSEKFGRLLSHKGAAAGHMFLLNPNKNTYMYVFF